MRDKGETGNERSWIEDGVGWMERVEGSGGDENSINSMEGGEKICKHAGTQKVPKC